MRGTLKVKRFSLPLFWSSMSEWLKYYSTKETLQVDVFSV